jgi:hypothetical protein
MRSAWVLSLPILVNGAAVKRSTNGLNVVPESIQKPVSVNEVEAGSNGVKSRELVWGPFNLPNGASESLIVTPLSGFCTNCEVLNAKVELLSGKNGEMEQDDGISNPSVFLSSMSNGLPAGKCSTVHPLLKRQAPASNGTVKPDAAGFVPPPITAQPKAIESGSAWSVWSQFTSALGAAVPSLANLAPEPKSVLIGALSGGVIGATLLAAVGSLVGAGLGAVLASPGGLSTLASKKHEWKRHITYRFRYDSSRSW